MREWVAKKRGTWVSYGDWNFYFYTATGHRRFKQKCVLASIHGSREQVFTTEYM